MKRRFDPRGLILFAVGLIVIVLDQIVKAEVRQHLPLNQSWNPIGWLDPIVTFTYLTNSGAAFGLFPSLGPVYVLVALAVIVVIIVFYRRLSEASWVLRLAFGLQLGGAAGNMVDRLWRGYVTDFIDFRVWPVFNIADMSVVVGTCLLAYYALFMDRQQGGQPLADRSPLPEQAPASDDVRETHSR